MIVVARLKLGRWRVGRDLKPVLVIAIRVLIVVVVVLRRVRLILHIVLHVLTFVGVEAVQTNVKVVW